MNNDTPIAAPTPFEPEGPPTLHTAILVAGMHRSGTSALTRVVSLLGARLPEALMPAAPENNERGFWESSELHRLHELILRAAGSSWDDVSAFPASWIGSRQAIGFRTALLGFLRDNFATAPLFVIKDPRISRFLPLWLGVLEDFGAEAKIIVPIRNPLEVAKSLAARDGFPLQKSCLLWLRHTLDSEVGSRGFSRSFVRYEDVMADWRRAAARIGKDLGLSWPADLGQVAPDIEAFLDHGLRHQRAAADELRARSDVVDWVSRAYEAALTFCEDGDNPAARQACDAIRAELDKADLAFKPVLEAELGGAKRTGAELREQVQILRDEQQLWRDQVQALRDDRQVWRDQVQALQHERNELHRSLQEKQRALDDMQRELTVARATLDRKLGLLRWMSSSRRKAQDRPGSGKRAAWPLSRLRATPLESLPGATTLRRDEAVIRDSGLFDAAYYLEHNPGVAAEGLDPLRHFLTRGIFEGRRPNSHFDVEWYLGQYPDVAEAGANPLLHYLRHGVAEGRDPGPQFSTSGYLKRYPDVAASRINPLVHFLTTGRYEGREAVSGSGMLDVLKLKPAAADFDAAQAGRIAVHAHVYYPDLAPEIADFLSNIGADFDLYVSTDTPAKIEAIRAAMRGLTGCRRIDLRIVENRGRDVGPIILTFGPMLTGYDVVLHVHTKRSPHNSILQGWRRYLLRALLGSPETVRSVLAHLNANPTVGLLYPATFRGVRRSAGLGGNREGVSRLAARAGLPTDAIEQIAAGRFPAGSMFWSRGAALEPLIGLGLTAADFEDEAGQTDGTLAHAIERMLPTFAGLGGFGSVMYLPADLYFEEFGDLPDGA